MNEQQSCVGRVVQRKCHDDVCRIDLVSGLAESNLGKPRDTCGERQWQHLALTVVYCTGRWGITDMVMAFGRGCSFGVVGRYPYKNSGSGDATTTEHRAPTDGPRWNNMSTTLCR